MNFEVEETRQKIWTALEGVVFWLKYAHDPAADLYLIQMQLEHALRVITEARAEYGNILPPK